VLDEQVGFVLRQVTQRHLAIFAAAMPEQLTPMQFAALAKLLELGATPQTQLGRLTAMDAATIKGVTDRLRTRGLVTTARDAADARLIVVALTPAGRALALRSVEIAARITRDTLAPLSDTDQATLLRLLLRLR
jgi:MarR family transcriptional regulator, lower aerobic nicotinate degradation pathway regulator